ncbi:Ste11p [Rhizophagus irregularis DAOM 197198w]|uniref:Ste11p n=2 Tax=Rhizophagus irregularis TaxID=588596 RepID=A0A015KBB9_RHIIW|nr:Ste11p [Rhizophagus irregularis DAOM 197198w]
MQLNINNENDVVFEWIPYKQFNKIKEIGKNDSITVYSSIWKDGPLCKMNMLSGYYARDPNINVALKYLHNSQDSVDFLINEAKKYSRKIFDRAICDIYGISQNPKTNNYILVLAWASGSEKIDNFIQEKQLNINNENDVVFEWIPYKQFNKIKEIGKNDSITVYSSIWKDGPLCKMNMLSGYYARDPNINVALKYLHNSQDSVDFLINEAKKYSTKIFDRVICDIYGISQNPKTNNYILVLAWASGSEKIDKFIQEMRLKIKWIPYNQLHYIKEADKNDLITLYSAIWKAGPLYKRYGLSNYTRNPCKEVALKCLHNSQESIDSLINKAKKYLTIHNAFQVLYGISQNPDTGDYILILNQTSGNVKIDDFIQEKQLEINDYDDIVFEWVPYNQFNKIEKTGKNGPVTAYSAIWKDDLLHYQYYGYTRHSNNKIALKCFHNSQKSIDSLINEANKYQTKHKAFQVLYGISQNPFTGDYILILNLMSGNEKIDDFILERQLKISNYDDIVLEWIPYNQFNEIKETGKNNLIKVYSATWKDGPLYKKNRQSNYTRNSNKEVALKCLHNSQVFIDSLINKAKKYPTKYKAFQVLYGISQNPDTGNYIFVINWTSGNEKIDDFIQERQLEVNDYYDIVLEWIPYNQFNEIKKTGKNDLITVYSAIWNNGPIYKLFDNDNYKRDSNIKVVLKCSHNLQVSIDSLIYEAKKYSIKHEAFQVLYGITQDPYTRNYIFVQNNSINLTNWISGNEKIDDFIQEMQLKISNYDDIVLEWIPYNQFNEIKETNKNNLITVYLAIWKDGPLYKKNRQSNYTRNSNKEVALKYLHNSQIFIDSLINKAKKYPIKHKAFQVLYGISQNPDTGDYIFVLNWTSGNEKIDDFIQERQLEVNDYNDIVLEWIPYNQFNEIKKTGKNNQITVYSAIWTNGPLYKLLDDYDYKRNLNIEVVLKCLHNSQESIDSLINEAKKYPTKHKAFQALYGISQNPDTEDYILVLMWTSGNDKIDYFIQEMQLKINEHGYDDIILEWIPYSQFNNIKEIGKGGFSTVYSAEWKNGPLEYNVDKEIYKRNSNKVIALKCLHNSQIITDKFLNEVKEYSISKSSNILNIYGISQNPDTKEYIMVLQYAKEGNFNHWISRNYEYFNWKDKISVLLNIVNGLKEIHQRNLVHRDFHTGNILILNYISYFSNCVLISDMGLCGEVDETKIYGVMPYMAPEVLRGKLYTQAADIYSFGMIMYFVATGKQPFGDHAHDHLLALDICKGIRPEISEPEAPKYYIDLMKKCWDLDKNNRPDIFEINKLITSFYELYVENFVTVENEEIVIQFKEAEEYRKANLTSIENYQTATHSQAIYTSRLLNPITKDLPKNDDDYNSQCLDQVI